MYACTLFLSKTDSVFLAHNFMCVLYCIVLCPSIYRNIKINLVVFCFLTKSKCIPHEIYYFFNYLFPEYKKTFKSLEDILINVAQTGIGAKKSRDLPPSAGNNYDFDKRLIVGFITKLHHPDVSDLIKAFLVSCFNSSVTDSSQAIQCNLVS